MITQTIYVKNRPGGNYGLEKVQPYVESSTSARFVIEGGSHKRGLDDTYEVIISSREDDVLKNYHLTEQRNVFAVYWGWFVYDLDNGSLKQFFPMD